MISAFLDIGLFRDTEASVSPLYFRTVDTVNEFVATFAGPFVSAL